MHPYFSSISKEQRLALGKHFCDLCKQRFEERVHPTCHYIAKKYLCDWCYNEFVGELAENLDNDKDIA